MNLYNTMSWDQKIDLKSQADVTGYLVAAGTYQAGALPMNGSGITLDGATMPYPTPLYIACSGNDTAVIFNVLGLDENGKYVSESITGGNAVSVFSLTLFSAIYSITPTAATSGNVTAGPETQPTGVCLSQAGSANTPLLLNGPLASGDFTLATPGFITITSAANELLNTFTISGIDQASRPYTISVAGGNADTVTIPVPFYSIKQGSLTMANEASGNISVGISSQTSTVWIPLDKNRTQFADMAVVSLTNMANLNYSVDYTNDNVLNGTVPSNIWEDTVLINQTASNQNQVVGPANFCRLRLNSWTSGSATFQVSAGGSYASYKNF